MQFSDEYVNPRGIPRVEFIHDVESFVKAKGITIDSILRQFQEQHSKYKLMEHKLLQNKIELSNKLPEIRKSIDTVTTLKEKLGQQQSLDAHYGLTDSVFCEAEIPPQNTVHLWLGANVMVEYTFDEALAVLEKNMKNAQTTLTHTVEDLAWLKDQQVIAEVNVSRVYNFDVVRRRKEKEQESK